MIQLKVLYNTSFTEDRCTIITTDETEISNFDYFIAIFQGKLECLHFIPYEELHVQYKDGKDTVVSLHVRDSFPHALRCAQAVQVQHSGG